MIKANYHTHTTFCDGADTPEEIVAEAIRLGCEEIGFSGHSYTSFDTSYCMSEEGTLRYCECISSLKEKYAGKIKILLGIEQDYFADFLPAGYDFVIGSVHYIKKDGVYIPVDESKKTLCDAVEKYYGGDFYSLAEDYYKLVADIYEKTRCGIVGHFDLITKFNRENELFDVSEKRYENAAFGAAEKLLATPAVFEVNTGGMARGYKTEPYPSKKIADFITDGGGKMIYSSDCHNKENLLYGFEKFGY